MRYNLLAVSSITYAMKSKKILGDMGIFCEVEKTPKNLASGCGYSIRVRDDPDRIMKILRQNGIAVKDVRTVER